MTTMNSCAAAAVSPLDVKPSICSHGATIETCSKPECGAEEVSKILHTLRNCDSESPLASDTTMFDFSDAALLPNQWEDWASPTPSTLDLGGLLQQALPAPCSAGTTPAGAMLLQEGGQRRAADSPSPGPVFSPLGTGLPSPSAIISSVPSGFQHHDPVVSNALLMSRDRHPSRSSLSEGYSTDHSAPSPAPSSCTGTTPRQLTKTELDKKERRKEQNRRAAKKCRIKKRALNETIQMEHKRLEEENKSKTQEILSLRKQVQQLQNVLQTHAMSGCKLRLQPD